MRFKPQSAFIAMLLAVLTLLMQSFDDFSPLVQTYEDGEIKCTFTTVLGRFHGDYISYYPKGGIKVKGSFDNNMRSGKWIVYDSCGKVALERTYLSPFCFRQHAYGEEFVGGNETEMVRNQNNFYSYCEVVEKNVDYSKRIYRVLYPKHNKALFASSLYKCIHNNVLANNLQAYADQDFQESLSALPKENSLQIIGFKIIEDFFLDHSRRLSETRIIAIAPLIYDSKTHDTLDAYWICFPDLRSFIAKELINDSDLPGRVKTLDDLFFFRCFDADIYMEENIYFKPIVAYKPSTEVEREALRIELRMIELEHDWWLYPDLLTE